MLDLFDQKHPDREPKRPWVALSISVAVVVTAKLAFALTLPGPWYLPDEVVYINHARHMVSEGAVFYQGPITGVQPGWPAVLTPLVWVFQGRPFEMYIGGVALACTLGTLIAFPVFLLVRRWVATREAVAVAVLCTVTPGACLYGWAVLSEPLFALLLLCCCAWFIRAVLRERLADFLASSVLAWLCFQVRPNGVCPAIAVVAGTIAWGLTKRQWKTPVLVVLAAAVLFGVGTALKSVNQPGPLAITNYGTEANMIPFWCKRVSEGPGLRDILIGLLREITYEHVATFAVFLPLAIFAAGTMLWRFRRLSAASRAILVGGLTLFASMFGVASIALINTMELTRMYGRYVESLTPVLIAVGAIAWARWSEDSRTRWVTFQVVLAMTLILAVVFPPGAISFTNNTGLWSWHLFYRATTPAVALILLVAVWLAFSMLHRHRLVAFMGIIAVAATSTVLVALHAYTYNRETWPARKMTLEACEAIRREIPAGAEARLWVDPTILMRAGEAAPGLHHVISWFRFGLPGVEVAIAKQDQIAKVGDFVLSTSGAPGELAVWLEGPLAVYKVKPSRRGLTEPGEERVPLP